MTNLRALHTKADCSLGTICGGIEGLVQLLGQFTEYAEGETGLSAMQVGALTETIQLMADGARYRIHGVLDAIAELESQA